MPTQTFVGIRRGRIAGRSADAASRRGETPARIVVEVEVDAVVGVDRTGPIADIAEDLIAIAHGGQGQRRRADRSTGHHDHAAVARGADVVDVVVALIEPVRPAGRKASELEVGFGLIVTDAGEGEAGFVGISTYHPTFASAGADSDVTGLAEAGEVFVDVTVAVVVAAVASLRGLIGRGRLTRDATGDITDLHAALTARLAEPEFFVDFAVAVVVDAIAALGSGRARLAEALHAAIDSAGDDAVAGAGTDADRASRFEVEVLVGITVTVVVDAIAPLRVGRAGDGVASSRAVVTADALARPLAGADAVGACFAQAEVLVVGAVAVIVEAVAGFFGRHARRDTAARPAVGRAQPDAGAAAFAGANFAPSAHVEVLVGITVAVIVEAVAGFGAGGTGHRVTDREAAGRTRPPARPRANADTGCASGADVEVLIGEPVAVVVDVVATLVGGPSWRRIACRVAKGGAAHRAGPRAGAVAVDAGRAEIETLIDEAIAVIVDGIAGLFARRAGPRAADRATVQRADEVAVAGAGADADATRLAEVEPLVDFAVAVFIGIVTGLLARDARLGRALCSAVGAAFDTTRLRARAHTDGAFAAQVEDLVDEAAAVVVDVVAALDAAGDAGRVGGGRVDTPEVWRGRVGVGGILAGCVGVRCIGVRCIGVRCIGVRCVGVRCVGVRCVWVGHLGIRCIGIRCVGVGRILTGRILTGRILDRCVFEQRILDGARVGQGGVAVGRCRVARCAVSAGGGVRRNSIGDRRIGASGIDVSAVGRAERIGIGARRKRRESVGAGIRPGSKQPVVGAHTAVAECGGKKCDEETRAERGNGERT